MLPNQGFIARLKIKILPRKKLNPYSSATIRVIRAAILPPIMSAKLFGLILVIFIEIFFEKC